MELKRANRERIRTVIPANASSLASRSAVGRVTFSLRPILAAPATPGDSQQADRAKTNQREGRRFRSWDSAERKTAEPRRRTRTRKGGHELAQAARCQRLLDHIRCT